MLLLLLALPGPNELSINRTDVAEPILGAAGLRKGACKFFLASLDLWNLSS